MKHLVKLYAVSSPAFRDRGQRDPRYHRSSFWNFRNILDNRESTVFLPTCV